LREREREMGCEGVEGLQRKGRVNKEAGSDEKNKRRRAKTDCKQGLKPLACLARQPQTSSAGWITSSGLDLA
jgi:hypothetical protein